MLNSWKGLTVAGAVLLTACASGVNITRTTPQYGFNATCAEAVTVFDTRVAVPSDYYEIAWITAEGNAVWTTDEDLVNRMKQSAAEVGATAIIANTSGPSATAAQILGAAVGTGDADRSGSALAIYQPAEETRVRAACASNP
jgi:uncharacterized protein YjdB